MKIFLTITYRFDRLFSILESKSQLLLKYSTKFSPFSTFNFVYRINTHAQIAPFSPGNLSCVKFYCSR